jgi:hypothetical protein
MQLDMRFLGELFCIVLLVVAVPDDVRADALRRASQAVHGNDEPSKPRERSDSGGQRRESRSSRHHHDHHRHHNSNNYSSSYIDDGDDDDDEDDAATIGALFQVVMSPWFIPYVVVNEMFPANRSIPSFPYSDDLAYTVPDDLTAPREVNKPFSMRMRLGAGARNENLLSGTITARADFSAPFALQVDYRVLSEADGGVRSYAGLGNAELLLRYADSQYLRFFTGLGYVQWADPVGLAHGVGLVYGFDAYPFRPISLGSRLSIGPLGHSYAFQWRSYVGVLISRCEIQVAYDHVDVGGAQLGGLQLGVEVHL